MPNTLHTHSNPYAHCKPWWTLMTGAVTFLFARIQLEGQSLTIFTTCQLCQPFPQLSKLALWTYLNCRMSCHCGSHVSSQSKMMMVCSSRSGNWGNILDNRGHDIPKLCAQNAVTWERISICNGWLCSVLGLGQVGSIQPDCLCLPSTSDIAITSVLHAYANSDILIALAPRSITYYSFWQTLGQSYNVKKDLCHLGVQDLGIPRAILFKLVAPTCTNEMQPRQFAMMDIWRYIQKLEGTGNFLSWYDLAAVDPQKKYGIVTRLRSTHLSTFEAHTLWSCGCLAFVSPPSLFQVPAWRACSSMQMSRQVWSKRLPYVSPFGHPFSSHPLILLQDCDLPLHTFLISPYLCSFEAWICSKTCGHMSSLVYQVPR